MITTRKPIGRLFVLANNKKGIISKSSIENDIENLIDIIKTRIVEKELDFVAENLLSKIFDLRFEVLEWLAINKKDFNEYFDVINKEIAQNRQVESYSKLFKIIINVLEIYENIALPIVSKIGIDNFNELINNLLENKPNYDTIKMLSYLPQLQLKFFKNWIDASLKLEFGLIVSDLVMTNQIKFTKSRINKELIEYLNNNIIRFGAYSIVLGFWKPDPKDNSEYLNKMRILVATIELDNKVYTETSQDELFELLNN